MITGLIALFFILMAIIMEIIATKKSREGIEICFCLFCICSVVSIIAFIAAMGVCSYSVISYQTQLDKIEKDKLVFKDRFGIQIKIIETYVEKYPLEENIYKNLSENLKLLLSLPQIKSDTLIMGSLTKALKIQDDLYKVDLERNSIEQKLDFHSYRFWSATLVSPKY